MTIDSSGSWKPVSVKMEKHDDDGSMGMLFLLYLVSRFNEVMYFIGSRQFQKYPLPEEQLLDLTSIVDAV